MHSRPLASQARHIVFIPLLTHFTLLLLQRAQAIEDRIFGLFPAPSAPEFNGVEMARVDSALVAEARGVPPPSGAGIAGGEGSAVGFGALGLLRFERDGGLRRLGRGRRGRGDRAEFLLLTRLRARRCRGGGFRLDLLPALKTGQRRLGLARGR